MRGRGGISPALTQRRWKGACSRSASSAATASPVASCSGAPVTRTTSVAGKLRSSSSAVCTTSSSPTRAPASTPALASEARLRTRRCWARSRPGRESDVQRSRKRWRDGATTRISGSERSSTLGHAVRRRASSACPLSEGAAQDHQDVAAKIMRHRWVDRMDRRMADGHENDRRGGKRADRHAQPGAAEVEAADYRNRDRGHDRGQLPGGERRLAQLPAPVSPETRSRRLR